jgi:chaperonin GroES
MLATVGNKVIVEQMMVEAKSLGGIIMSDAFLEVSAKGKVVAVGCGTVKQPMKIPLGVECFFVKGGGEEIEIDGKKYLVMGDRDIRAYYKN